MNYIIIREIIESKGEFTFSRSSGPGGQNVNKVNTKVTLHLKVKDLGIDNKTLERIKARLANRINSSSELVFQCDEERSQKRNRELVIHKSSLLILNAMKIEKKRKKTKPSLASKKRRLEAKKKQSLKKEIRNFKAAY